MKTILFKSGKEIEVSQKVANILKERITQGCNNYQMFFEDNGNLDLMINVSEISAITTKPFHE